MRGVSFTKIEGHENLIRDMSSNAIINNDDLAYKAYQTRREQEKKQREELNNLKSDVKELKDDLKEIKNLLAILAKGNQ